MAFVTQVTSQGYTYPKAYVKAHIRLSTPQITVIELSVWPTAEDRLAGAEPVNYHNNLRTFSTNLSLQSDNPIAYAYDLLESSNEFEHATWNV